jgi:hypothetical protein
MAAPHSVRRKIKVKLLRQLKLLKLLEHVSVYINHHQGAAASA